MSVEKTAALTSILALGQGDTRDKPRSILRALRLGLARGASESLDLPMSVIGAKQAYRQREELSDTLQDGRLLLAFSTSEGRIAAACIDIGCVSAILQKQTIGSVSPGQVSEREFTDTDAAMVAPVIELALTRAAELAGTAEDGATLKGCAFVARYRDVRALMLELEDDAYRVFDLTLEIASGQRQGQFYLILPDRPAVSDDSEIEAPGNGQTLDHASGVLRADLTAVICQTQVPLAAFSGLKAGDVLPLAGVRLDRTELWTIERGKVASGRLGQCGGMRAVRVNEDLAGLHPEKRTEGGFVEKEAVVTQHTDPTVDDTGDIIDHQDEPAHSAVLPAEDEPVVPDNFDTDHTENMLVEITELAGLYEADSEPGKPA